MHFDDKDQSTSSEAQTAATDDSELSAKWLNFAPFQLSEEQTLKNEVNGTPFN